MAIEFKGKKNKQKISIGILAAVFVASFGIFQVISANVAQAATRTWVGGGTTAVFSDPANWSGGVIPQDGDVIVMDEAVIPASANYYFDVNNDITGLELSGISFVNMNSDFDSFIITGNEISVQGTIETDDIYYFAGEQDNFVTNVLDLDLTLTGPLTIEGVAVGANGSNYSMNLGAFPLQFINKGSDISCASTGVKSSLVGSGTIDIVSTGEFNAVQLVGTSSGFTGAINVASGAGLTVTAETVQNASMIKSEGRLSFTNYEGGPSAVTVEAPMRLSGELTAFGGSGSHLGGCSGVSADTSYTLSGGVELIGDLTYAGYMGNTLPTNTHIAAPYRPHQFTITNDTSFPGTVTTDAPILDTVPDAPTGLTATPSSNQVSLGWTAPVNDGGAEITDYLVQYKLSSASTWTTFNDGSSTNTSALITGLADSQVYDVRVSAVNVVGTSLPVLQSGVVLVGVAGAPTGLNTTPSDSQVDLSWTAPANNGGTPITDYIVEYKLSSDSTWLNVAHTASTATSRAVTGLANGSTYDFRVAAVNAEGQGSFIAVTNILVPAVIAGAPTSLSGIPASGQVALSWVAPANNGGSAITDYKVEYKLTTSSTWIDFTHTPSTAVSRSVTGLANGSSYDFRVATVNGAGTSGYVSIANIELEATVPGVPTGFSAAPSAGQVSLSWVAPVDDGGAAISDYLIEYRLSSDSTWLNFTHTPSTATDRAITGLANGSTYDFRVAAVNAQGSSSFVAATGVTVPAVVASEPTGLNAVPSDAQVELSWVAPSSDGGSAVTDYKVEYKLSAGSLWTSVTHAASTSTNRTVDGLSNGTSYDFRVAAVNSVGDSAFTAVTGINLPAVAPSAPQNLTATPAVGQVLLDWDAPASSGGAAITDYAIQYKLSADSSWSTFAHTASGATSRTVTGLTNGLSYDFRVSAVNTAGTGPEVSTMNVTVQASVASAPQNLMVTPSSEQAVLTWATPATDGGSSITDYTIQYKLTTDGVWTTYAHAASTATTATITGLTDENDYDFRVSAVNAEGQSPFVTVLNVGVSAGTTAPDAPTNLEATLDSSERVTLEWTTPGDNGGLPITDYVIGYKPSESSTWQYVSVDADDGTSYTFTSELTDGVTYDFSVAAVNADGNSPAATFSNFEYIVEGDGGNGGGGTTNPGDSDSPTAPGAPNTGVQQVTLGNLALIVAQLAAAAGATVWLVVRYLRRSKVSVQSNR